MSEITGQRQSEQARGLDDRVEQVSTRIAGALESLSRRVVGEASPIRTAPRATRLRASTSASITSRIMWRKTWTRCRRALATTWPKAGRRTSESLHQPQRAPRQSSPTPKQSLADLSSEVMTLQGVLANKQARGAFGQMRMETIIRDALPVWAPTSSRPRFPTASGLTASSGCRTRLLRL